MSKSEKEYGRFLTDTHRQYLLGRKDYDTPNAEYQTRSKIRSRTEGAFHDLFTVGTELSNKDAEKIFEGAGEIQTVNKSNGGRDVLPGHPGSLSAIIALGCRGHKLNGRSVEQFVTSIVKNGIKRGVADAEGVDTRNVVVDIELNKVATYDSVDEMAPLEKFENGLGLTPKEWNELGQQLSEKLDRETIPFDEIADLADEHLVESAE